MASSPETQSSTSSARLHNPGPATRRIWSREEDEALIAAVARYGTGRGYHSNWPRIAATVGNGRTRKDCSKRWFNSLDPAVKKGKWSREEDDALRRLHAELGPKWKLISQRLPGRQEYQVAKRWGDVLSPDLASKEPWTPLEDALLLQLYEAHGSKWSIIAESLSGRSPVACRNRCRKYHGQPSGMKNGTSLNANNKRMPSDYDERREAISDQDRGTTNARASLSATSAAHTAEAESPRSNNQDDCAHWPPPNDHWDSAGAGSTDHQLPNRPLARLPAAISSDVKNSEDISPINLLSWGRNSDQVEKSTAAQLYQTQEFDIDMEENATMTESASDSDIQEIMTQLGFSSVDSSISLETADAQWNTLPPSGGTVLPEISLSNTRMASLPSLPQRATMIPRTRTTPQPIDNAWSLALALQTSQASVHISTKLLRRLVQDAAYTLDEAQMSDVASETIAQS